MVVCPVCNKENNEEEYCTDCGTKLVDIKDNPDFEFDENKDISKVNELNIYLKELNEKISLQKKYLDELNNDPLIKEYGTISKIKDEHNELKRKIEELEQNNKKVSLKLVQEQRKNSELQAEIDKTNFCPNCGYKL